MFSLAADNKLVSIVQNGRNNTFECKSRNKIKISCYAMGSSILETFCFCFTTVIEVEFNIPRVCMAVAFRFDI